MTFDGDSRHLARSRGPPISLTREPPVVRMSKGTRNTARLLDFALQLGGSDVILPGDGVRDHRTVADSNDYS